MWQIFHLQQNQNRERKGEGTINNQTSFVHLASTGSCLKNTQTVIMTFLQNTKILQSLKSTGFVACSVEFLNFCVWFCLQRNEKHCESFYLPFITSRTAYKRKTRPTAHLSIRSQNQGLGRPQGKLPINFILA